jgi:hypothetical protein
MVAEPQRSVSFHSVIRIPPAPVSENLAWQRKILGTARKTETPAAGLRSNGQKATRVEKGEPLTTAALR